MLKQISVAALAITLLGSTTIKAQEMKHDIVGAAQVQITYRKGNTQQLNQDLGRVGIPPLASKDVWINLSMSHFKNNWIMEDGLDFTPISTTSVNNLQAHYNQYQLYFRTGYNLSKSADMRVYPFVGINFSDEVLRIQDNARTQNTQDFTTELLNSTSSKTFYRPNFGIELGAGFDYLIKLKPKQMDAYTIERNIPIGIRAGYYINTYASDWRIESNTLNNGPTSKQSAVFVSFNIGLGYKVKK